MIRRRTTAAGPNHRALPAQRDAFTLIEVILAIAILGLSLAAIGQVFRRSYINIKQASDGLHAQMTAESVLAELKTGIREVTDFGPDAVGTNSASGEWMVQIAIEPAITEELVQVRIRVGRTLADDEPAACELVRWMPNPSYATTTESAL